MAERLETQAESYIEACNLLLKNIEPAIIRKAWFTLSHLLLDESAKVVDMGCDDGQMTYAMAAMSPKLKFVGVDKSKRQINKAKEQYKLFNLDFQVGEATADIFDEESVDAIINSYVLHEVYSGSRYSERIVSETLYSQFRALKKGGAMFIRDFARPPPGEFVLLELLDKPSTGSDLAHFSEADLLIWYAEHARPRQDAGCGGFFLEELPQRFPKTRLFRLPYKWAYEFIMRKDDRNHWESELPMEYTFFTPRDFRKELSALGARVQYSAPYWDEDIINSKFEGRFRLYDDNGNPLGDPPTCFIAVAYKMAERKSLVIEERRPSIGESGRLKITAMRDEKTGRVMDVASRDISISEILPYYVDEEGRLKIYLHDGIARSITNAVPRGGMNIDERRWSGHMVEPIAVENQIILEMPEFDMKNSVLFARDHLGLKPEGDAVLEHGPDYYPAPDYIDEKINTYYLKIRPHKGIIQPKSLIGVEKFQAKGIVREFDAQQILNAITVGMIPNGRLELQILALFQHLNLRAQTWTDKQINLQVGKISAQSNLKDILQRLGAHDKRFREIKGSAGQLRPVHSTFVEEGQSRGALSGLSAENVDFIIHDGKTVNTAIVLPLGKGMKDDVHAGFLLEHLPVPQRHEGNGLTISAPSFNIPPEITNQRMLKKYIAEQFGVLPNMVIKLGESYFSHIGMTPQKIYPFVVSVPPGSLKLPNIHFLPFYQFMLLRKLTAKQPHFMLAIARAYRYFHEELRFDAKHQVKAIVKQRFEGSQPDWSIPLRYDRIDALKSPSEAKKPQFQNMPQTRIVQRPLTDPARSAPVAPVAPTVTMAKTTSQVAPQVQKTPNYAAETISDYESELEAFMETHKDEFDAKPKPEKW